MIKTIEESRNRRDVETLKIIELNTQVRVRTGLTLYFIVFFT